jgi:toxin-antitoxin system PIN domain toxin
MTLLDANLLVYASVSSMPQHAAARQWLQDHLNSAERVGMPWESLLAFARLVTNPRVFERPLRSEEAWLVIEGWLALPNVWIPVPTPRHAATMARLVATCRPTANLIPDTHLAAMAIDQGLELLSTDGDFARFGGLRWRNPLILPC